MMTSAPIVIRPIQHGDIPAYWAALDAVARERRYFTWEQGPPVPGTASFVAENIECGNPHVVALDGDHLVGWCDIVRQKRVFAHLGVLGIGIIASHRGRGIGRQLLASAIGLAWQAGFKRVELEVYATNLNAIHLYEQFGFRLEGTRRLGARLEDDLVDVHGMGLLAPGIGGDEPPRGPV